MIQNQEQKTISYSPIKSNGQQNTNYSFQAHMTFGSNYIPQNQIYKLKQIF